MGNVNEARGRKGLLRPEVPRLEVRVRVRWRRMRLGMRMRMQGRKRHHPIGLVRMGDSRISA
jgi:hypothetical protein